MLQAYFLFFNNRVWAKLYIRSKQKPCMKNLSVALNVVLLIAVGILYFLFFKNNGSTPAAKRTDTKDVATAAPAKIAYFEMDSLEVGYKFIKDVQEQLTSREQGITSEMNNLKKNYMDRIQQLQAREKTMTPEEGQAAQQEINQMQQKIQGKEAELTQSYQAEKFRLLQETNKKIEDFLKTFNQEKKYAFIFSHSPGDFIYYKDSSRNITSEIIEGLNAALPAKK